MPSALNSVQSHELMKAYLYIQTASIATANIKQQMKSTEAYIQYNSINGNYNEHMAYQAELDEQEHYLEVWQDRWVEAAMTIVDYFAMGCLGRALPGEVLAMIRRELRRGDLVLDPLR